MPTPAQLIARAEAASSIRRFETAAEYAMAAIQLNPEYPDAYASLARALIGQRRLPEAIEQLKQAIELDPEEEWYFQLQAIAYFCLNNCGQAERLIREALRLEPESPVSYRILGDILSESNKPTKSLAAYAKSLELDPRNVKALLGTAHANLELKRYDVAESFFRSGLELEPNHAGALNDLGVCFERQNKNRQAALAFKAALVANPQLSVAKSNTKTAVENLGPGAGGLTVFMLVVVAIVTSFAARWNRRGELFTPLAFLIGASFFFLVAVVIGLVVRYRKRELEKLMIELEKTDPELLAIYQRIRQEYL